MCAIVDANIANEVFNSARRIAAGEKFFEWINTGTGALVIGGELLNELNKTSACAVERCALLVGANPTQQLSLRLVAARAVHGGNNVD